MVYNDRIVKRRREEETIFFPTDQTKRTNIGVNFISY